MADQHTAAPATASAVSPAPGSAPGGSAALSTPPAPLLSPELKAAASFDVEAFLAGSADAGPGETETTESAETGTTTTTAETESAATSGEEAEGEAETETETETESEAAAAGEEEEAEAEAEETEETDTAPEGLKPKAVKRFNKLLSQRDAAKAEAREAKAELEALKTQLGQREDEPVPVKVAGDPLGTVTNAEQLEAHEHFHKQVKAWCRRNPTGGTPPVELTGGVERELSAEEVVGNLENAETMLEELPKRRAFLAEFAAKRAEARQAHPRLFTAGTAEHATAKALLPRLINFRTQADQDSLLAKLVKVELMEREERDGVARYTRVELKKPGTGTGTGATSATAGATPKPNLNPKPAPKAATGSTMVPPVRATTGKAPQAAAWEKLSQPGGEVDVEELMVD